MKSKMFHIQDLCMVGVLSAVIAVMAQIAIPMPFGVPMTMQTFALTLAGIVLGSKKGALSSLVYILLGVIGLPVFANFTGGWQSITGPTSGFILSFPLMTYTIGLGTEYRNKWKGSFIIGIIVGTSLNFVCGTLMFCLLMQSSLPVAFTTCVLPFIPAAILKAFLSSILGLRIRNRLQTLF